jgi:hypothetical protein
VPSNQHPRDIASPKNFKKPAGDEPTHRVADEDQLRFSVLSVTLPAIEMRHDRIGKALRIKLVRQSPVVGKLDQVARLIVRRGRQGECARNRSASFPYPSAFQKVGII